MGGQSAVRVFLSYRREDSAGYAGRLHDSLSARLTRAEVFMDVDEIEPGVDFMTAIAEAVGRCDVLLALIGTRWAAAATTSGERRFDDPDDYVVAEIAAALQQNTLVIPVLIEGATMPKATELPERIGGLARRNALELDTVSWSRDLETLVAALRRQYPELVDSERPRAAWGRQNKRWVAVAVVIAAVAAIVVSTLDRGSSPGEGSRTFQSVVVTPDSGPGGITLEISGGPCPETPAGRRPGGVYFGLHDPRAKEKAEENPATGGVPLITGKSWKGQLRIPDGIASGPYFVYAGCWADAGDGSPGSNFYEYLSAQFDAVPS